MNMELSSENNGQTEQLNKEEDLFEKFYNDASLNPSNVEAKAPSPEAAPEEVEVESSGDKAAEQAEVVASPDAPPSQPDPNGWLNEFPEELRSKAELLAKEAARWQKLHSDQASKNRKLHNDLENLRKKVEAPKTPAVTEDDDGDDTWTKLKEADPILIGEMEKRLKRVEELARREATEKAREQFAPIEQERQEQFVSQQLHTLDNTVPNWREVIQDPMYQQWFEYQTPGIKSMYGSPYANDSIQLLQLYARDMEQYFGQQQQPAAPATPAVSDPKVAKIAEQRQEKLSKSAPVMPGNVGVAKQAALTQEQLFQKFYDDPEAIVALQKASRGAN